MNIIKVDKYVAFYESIILWVVCKGWEYCTVKCVRTSNGNASETKANESFDNGVFFDIEAKRTASTVSKLFSKRSEHIR